MLLPMLVELGTLVELGAVNPERGPSGATKAEGIVGLVLGIGI